MWTSALRTSPGVTKIAATLWEVLSVAVNLVTDLAPIRKLAKVRKLAMYSVSGDGFIFERIV